MARFTQKTKLIKHMTTDELSAFRKLLEERIAGHVYRVNDETTFKTPIKKLITITLNSVTLRLFVESGAELRERQKGSSKTP